MIGRELSCSSPSAAVDPDERVAPKRDMVALGLYELASAAAATGVVGVPDERVAPKRDMVALGLDELAAAAAGGVVGIPAPAGVRIDVEDGGVPLVGVVVMFDFYLGESKNPNHVEEEAMVSFTGTGYEKLRNEGAAG